MKKYLFFKIWTLSPQLLKPLWGNSKTFLEMLIEGKMCIWTFYTYYRNRIKKFITNGFNQFSCNTMNFKWNNLSKIEFYFFETLLDHNYIRIECWLCKTKNVDHIILFKILLHGRIGWMIWICQVLYNDSDSKVFSFLQKLP